MGDGIWIGMIAGLLLVMGGAAVAEVGPGALVYAAICLVLATPFAWNEKNADRPYPRF